MHLLRFKVALGLPIDFRISLPRMLSRGGTKSMRSPTPSPAAGPTMRSLSEVIVEIPVDNVPPPLIDDEAEIPSPYDSPVLVDPPSPTPTEIVVDEQPQDIMNDLSQYGIKVRDFAFHPDPDVIPAPTISNPIFELMEYDNVLFEQPRRKPVSGRALRRLLEVGWVTEEESVRDWLEMDWQSLRAYDAKGKHQWKPSSSEKPNDEEREEGRWQRAKVLGTLGTRIRPPSTTQPPSADVDVDVDMEPPGLSIAGDKGKKRAHDVEPVNNGVDSDSSPPKRSRPSPEVVPQQFPAGRMSGASSNNSEFG